MAEGRPVPLLPLPMEHLVCFGPQEPRALGEDPWASASCLARISGIEFNGAGLATSHWRASG